jgi:regulator of nucleoside diphosphate kinase
MASRRKIVITDADCRRLGTLIERARYDGWAEDRCLDDLEYELERAKIVAPEKVPADVVTMNSTVRLRDLDTDELETYTLVYPAEAKPDDNRISILAPIGTALLGYRLGDVIEWPVPNGTVHLKVEEIVFQPEREGTFEL